LNDAKFATNLINRSTGIDLMQCKSNLLFCALWPLHGTSFVRHLIADFF
jgi:hypothetical protein